MTNRENVAVVAPPHNEGWKPIKIISEKNTYLLFIHILEYEELVSFQ